MDAKDYFNGGNNASSTFRVCTPAYERMKHLYALGHNAAEISEILHQEFMDIDYNPCTPAMVKRIILDNKNNFEQFRMELGLLCREEIQKQTARLFDKVQNEELDHVDVFVIKWKEARDELRTLDLSEMDEDGNFKNTSRIFVLIELCDKLQSRVAKIVGTDAIREVEIYRQKAAAKAEAEQNKGNLLPPLAKGQTLEASTTNFI